MSTGRRIKATVITVVFIGWLGLCALYSAAWYFAIGPILVIAWFSTKTDAWYDAAAESKKAISEQIIQLKVLVDRVTAMEEKLSCNESDLKDISERVLYLLDEQLYAQRMKGEIPWPNGKVEQRFENR